MRAGSQIYVSASIPDRPLAQDVVALLQAEEGYDVHWEESELRALSSNAIAAAEAARCVLVIWSYTSVSSRWVMQEALEANARNALVEIEIAPVDRPTDGECISFENWDKTTRAPEWRRLMEQVRAVVGRPRGDLPIKEQMSPTIGAAMLAAVGAITMMLGARPPSPDLLALVETSGDPGQPANWAVGGPERSQPFTPASEQLAALPIAFEPVSIEIQWVAAPAPLESAGLTHIPALEAEEISLAYNAEFEAAPEPNPIPIMSISAVASQ